MLRLLLVEDHAAFRGALALLLDLRPGMRVVAQCGSLAGCRALGGLLTPWTSRSWTSSCPTARGRSSSPVLRGANPSVRVLILTASIEPGLAGRMAEAGADGVLDKTAALSEIASEVARWGGAASPATGRPAKFPNLARLGDARGPSGP
jgi:DNA-binding NarL/FixJ family response regulator